MTRAAWLVGLLLVLAGCPKGKTGDDAKTSDEETSAKKPIPPGEVGKASWAQLVDRPPPDDDAGVKAYWRPLYDRVIADLSVKRGAMVERQQSLAGTRAGPKKKLDKIRTEAKKTKLLIKGAMLHYAKQRKLNPGKETYTLKKKGRKQYTPAEAKAKLGVLIKSFKRKIGGGPGPKQLKLVQELSWELEKLRFGLAIYERAGQLLKRSRDNHGVSLQVDKARIAIKALLNLGALVARQGDRPVEQEGVEKLVEAIKGALGPGVTLGDLAQAPDTWKKTRGALHQRFQTVAKELSAADMERVLKLLK